MFLRVEKYRYEVFIVLFGIIMAFCAFFIVCPDGYLNAHYTGGDAQGYLDAGSYLWNKGTIHYFRTIGYPLFTGIPIMLGFDEAIVRFVLVWFNFALFIASAIFVFKIIVSITSWKKLGLLSALLFLLSPGLLFTNLATLSEPLFITVVLASLLCLKDYILYKKGNSLVYFNLLLLFSAAIRPINLYFSILAAIISILILFFKRENYGYSVAIFLGICVFILFPLGMMKRTYGVTTYTFNSSYMLYHYIGSYASSIPNSSQVDMYDSFHRKVLILDASAGEKSGIDGINWRLRDSFYKTEIKEILRTKKKQFLVAYFNNFIENSSTGSHLTPKESELRILPELSGILTSITKYENMMFSIMAILLLPISFFAWFRRQGQIRIVIFVLIILTLILNLIALSSLSFWQGDRFSIVFYPLVLIALSALIWTILGRETGHSQGRFQVSR